jgi:ribonuclease HIII
LAEEKIFKSWMMKPCSDGVSIDVRPPSRFQIDLLRFIKELKGFRSEITSSSIAIFYNKENIKITLYQSGRMLIETRDLETAEKIVSEIIDLVKRL